jgi:RNA polymerase sigma-70 factor (ECF subfamily)
LASIPFPSQAANAVPLPVPIDATYAIDSPAAFAQLYEETHITVYRYVYGLFGGPQQDVEDIAAETFIRAWKARHRFHGSRNAVIGWLLVIARRLVIDRHRRLKVRGFPEDIDQLDLAAPIASPEERTVQGEQMRILRAMLLQLPNRQREMLVLRYILAWQVKQIAEQMGIPQNTVSVTIRRTLARLRRDWPSEAHPFTADQGDDH